MTKKSFNLRNVVAIAICLAGMAIFSGCKITSPEYTPNDKGRITPKIRFSGNPNESDTRSAVKSKSPDKVEGAEELEKFYSLLGNKKGSITPTMLKMPLCHIALFSVDSVETREEHLLLYDFAPDLANPITVSADEIQSGNYKYLFFCFNTTGADNVLAMVSFPTPDYFNLDTHICYSNLTPGHPSHNSHLGIITSDGNNMTTPLWFLNPSWIDIVGYGGYFSPGSGPLGTKADFNTNIFMGGDTYKLINHQTYYDDIFPGLPHIGVDPSIVVPFEGIVIPPDAKAVRFEIYWDLTDLIEWYEGATNSPNDDIFVLRNGFWEGFSIRAFIEYE